MTSSYYNPVTQLTYNKDAQDVWRIDQLGAGTSGLNYKGSITPPTDPATLIADPFDGDFYVYSVGGTAWNGDTVLGGNWVVYNTINSWQNIQIGTVPGVASVTVSGGVLSLAGTASDPVINLEKTDLETALDNDYVSRDGTNTYDAATLTFSEAAGAAIANDTSLSLSVNGANRFTSKQTENESFVDLYLADTRELKFRGNAIIDAMGTYGDLYADGKNYLTWGDDTVKLGQPLDADGNQIKNVGAPTFGLDAANKAYVDAVSFTLSPATSSTLGGIKVGDGLNVTVDGTLSLGTITGYLPLTGGTLSGYTKVQGALFKIRYDSDGTAGEFKFYSKDDQNIVRMVGGDTAPEGYMSYGGKCDAASHVLNRGYGDARYLQLTGGSLTGSLTMVIDSSTANKEGLVIKGKDDAGNAIDLLRSYHQNDSTRTMSDAVNYKGRTDNADNLINRAALDAALAAISGAELATKTVAGTVKVNVTTSETAGIDAVYREGSGKLMVRKAFTGTNNSSDASGTQRGVAAFHSDSFASSNGFITLKAATTSKMGGVKASSSSTDTSSAFCIDGDGKGKIRNATNSTIGVQRKGQICTTGGSPSSSDFNVGQMVMRTDTKAVYIKVS